MKKFEKEIAIIEQTVDELERITAYAKLLGSLCEMGTYHDEISPQALEAVFKDIANVTTKASHQMHIFNQALNTL